MKVLLVTFYYPPDLSAGSFRAASLVDALVARGSEVHVLTSSPNRYAAIAATEAGASASEQPGVRVTRIKVPAHQSGIADQIRTFAVFARGAWQAARASDANIVVATSSRLLTASLGAGIAKRLGKPLYLDIRDIFSETVANVFGSSPIRHAMPAISLLERWTLGRAARINLVSPPFADYFAPVMGHRDFATFTNGIDDMFLQPLPAPAPDRAGNGPVVLAAGNIGEGQGLHHVLPGLAKAHPGVTFRIVGDGGRRAMLAQAVRAASLTNVELVDPMPRDRLLTEYANTDVLFMHLNDLPAFHRVLPSKMFEYAATGKPVLAGIAGYSRELLEANADGVATFDPCDVEEAARALDRLLSGPSQFDRTAFAQRFARRTIMAEMAADVARIATSG